MSTISSLVLVLSLLFFPFHGCGARSFGAFNDEPVENNKGSSLVRVSVKPETKASEATKIERDNHDETIDDDKMNPERKSTLQKVEVLGTVQTEPAVSVSRSWKVPHKKRGEGELGFNLDYLPPKTHPPHHN